MTDNPASNFTEGTTHGGLRFRRLKDVKELRADKIHLGRDNLTGLQTREAFEKKIKDLRKGSFSILFIDMDGLKQANDLSKSHTAGDRGLKTIAAELNLSIRDRNGDGTDEAFRYGGDEFAVILNGVTDQEILRGIATRINTSVGKHSLTYDKNDGTKGQFSLTVSIGGAVSSLNDQINSDVVTRADSAVYEAKNTGRNKVVIHSNV